MRLRPELALLALLAACGHAATAPAQPSSAPSTVAAPTPTPVPLHIVSSGTGGQFTTMTAMKRGRTIYVVRAASFVADTASGRTTTGSGNFTQPHITFVDRTGSRTVADAPEAVVTSADKSVLMTGGVRARSQDGTVLACNRLRYDGTTERIHGDGHVVMTTPSGLVLVGDEIDGNARLTDVRVYKHS